MNKYQKIVFFITIILNISILLLMTNGKITFGYGLGDLLFYYLIILWLAILLITYLIIMLKNKRISKFKSRFITFVLIFISLITINGFTFNRASEYPWNGRIFMISFKEYKQIKEIKYQNKIDSLNIVIDTNPRDYETTTKKGMMYFEKEEWDLAMKEFEKALKINPEYFKALYNLGFCYCNNEQHDFEKALPFLKKAQKIDSTNEDINRRIRNIESHNNKDLR